MRIAFVNDTFLLGRGSDEVVYELAKRLGKKHSVDVITTQSNRKEKNFRIILVKGRKLVTGSWKDFLFFMNLRSFRDAVKEYDIINLHHATLNPAFLGIKNVVTTYHGSPFISISEHGIRSIGRSFANALGRRTLVSDERVVAISSYLKDEIGVFIPKEKVVVIRNGIDLKRFRPTHGDKNYMLYVGRLEKHKRVEELIKVSKEVEFNLKIAGYGPEEKNLKELSKKINAPVQFLGRVSDMKKEKLYQNCSFFVSASCWEGFGLIFVEAAACGKPSVAYNVTSMPEVVLDGKTGFLVNNSSEFIEKVKLLVNNKKLRMSLGKKAAKFSKEFSWDKVSKRYEKLFLDIVNG